jgi:two-component system alkaline phosphatase synthesis response regulator PhoP
MANETILIVEDEGDILELLRYNLNREGFKVLEATSGEAALDIIRKDAPDLVLLDLMLPKIGGLEVCRRVRGDSDHKSVPIIMLTARGEEADIVAGLELGADDYMTKPFSPRVLLARIRAVLRRHETAIPGDDEVLHIHDLVIHPGRHEVLVAGDPVVLTRTEFQVLHYLARRPGWVFTRYQIVDAVHGDDYAVTERSVDVQVVGLRKKLGDAGKYIETVRGVGYRFSS